MFALANKQWGVYSISTAWTSAKISFPISFATTNYSFVGLRTGTTATENGFTIWGGKTVSSINIFGFFESANNVTWIAIGK